MESSQQVKDFIIRWEKSGGAERANYGIFLSELTDLLGVERPNPTTDDDREDAYVFERSVPNMAGGDTSAPCRIDLYKRGCFILETKQGVTRKELTDPFLKTTKPGRKGHGVRGTGGWDVAMYKAKGQAEGYAHALPATEGRPPFLVVVDVGHCIELYSEFTCTGGIYRPFPDSSSHRIWLSDLEKAAIRERLRLVWSEPLTLDPSRHSAKVTQNLAVKLALLAKSLEFSGHAANDVSLFLMRCLFTFFAEDIGLLPDGCFTSLLEELRGQTELVPDLLTDVWKTMNTGGVSSSLKKRLLYFNGGLFENVEGLALTDSQHELLIEAGKADWKHVEPAIFGTLLERALDPAERHHLGAHYTPRDYVERLVLPTVIKPLTTEWETIKTKVVTHLEKGQNDAAIKLLNGFHHKLCTVTVLDPACGSGNFLYVTFELLKRLEGEVLTFLDDLGEHHTMLGLEGTTVDPHQFLGLEVNPRAAVITGMVLWIGYLQWHFRTHGNVMPPVPVIKKFNNVECRDAVLTWDKTEPLLDGNGEAITRWDGVTCKQHPATGEDVPDETARIPVLRYLKPRPAVWPQADYVVGNPPFIGNKRMRLALGDGYVEALRKVWTDVPDSADFVMYWWQQAAELTRQGKLQSFGFITTNSLTQEFNRRVLQQHLSATPALSLSFAIPDHPWVDSADGAAVRIAMTVGCPATTVTEGMLSTVIAENTGSGEGLTVELASRQGVLHADLTIGANVAATVPLKANDGLGNRGMIPHGEAFLVTAGEALKFGADAPLRPYRNGKDLTSRPRGIFVIDTFGYTESELKTKHPTIWQWLHERVKPERDQNSRKSRRENWWLFAENQPRMRRSVQGLSRYIATVQTAKHRFFVFLDATILPDDKLIAIASDDAFHLGVLSSRIHVVWALAAGATLEDRPVYNKTKCFDAFPFPCATDEQQQSISTIAEALDTHRKTRQEEHPDLGITDIYNVLEKLKTGVALTDKERAIDDKGLVTLLKNRHDELDTAVFAAYGWPVSLTDNEILDKLVVLNKERAAEEKQGTIRWLRPLYQNPANVAEPLQTEMELETDEPVLPEKQPLPKEHTAQLQTVKTVLAALKQPATADEVAACFIKARAATLHKLLDDLVALGLAQKGSNECYSV